jgi:outer membrane lipoprotein-sorting protein
MQDPACGRVYFAAAVTGLPDLLALLAGADSSFRSVRLTIRSRRDDALASEAFGRHTEELQRRSGGRPAVVMFVADDDTGEQVEPVDEIARIWLEQPDRFRCEVEGRFPRTTVSDGRTTWHLSEHAGTMREDRGTRPQLYASLIEPAVVIPGLDFGIPEQTTFAGREALKVRARRRPADPMGLWHDVHGIAPGADEYDLFVDAERGILLRAAAFLDGREFAVSEVTELAFDEPLDPSLFTYAPLEGEVVRTAEEARIAVVPVDSAQEAASRVPFTLFVATGLGPSWSSELIFVEGRAQPTVRASVAANYTRIDDAEQFQLSQQAAPAETRFGPDWDRVDRDGRAMYVYKPSEELPGWPSMIRLDREGTRIELTSQDLGRERLLEIAESLAPA